MNIRQVNHVIISFLSGMCLALPVAASDFGTQFSQPVGIVQGSNTLILHKLEITSEYLHKLEKQKVLIPAGTPSGVSHETHAIINLINNNDIETARVRWGQMLQELKDKNKLASIDINGLVQYVLREAYMEATADLRYHAERVKYFNEMKSKLREHLSELRQSQSDFMKNQTENNVTSSNTMTVKLINCMPTYYSSSTNINYVWKNLRLNEMEKYLDEWEKQLAAIGDDAQLENIDLQNQLQKQQQTVQMLSNVSKVLHDTALAVIRKIG